MKEQILTQCRKSRNKLKNMTSEQIYEFICNTFFIKDYAEARECSFIIFNELNSLF